MYYLEISLITFILSTFFAIGGVGSAIALVPVLNLLGIQLNVAKAIGLLVNTAATTTSSWLNFKKKLIDFNFAIPLVVAGIIFSPLGAYSSAFINEKFVKALLIIFLIISSLLLLFYKKKPSKNKYQKKWILFLVGAIIAYFAGILGIGGGSFLIPILIFLGYDVKKVAITVSFIIPFSTFPAFLSYVSFVHIDWILLTLTFLSAILGGYVGNKIMHNSKTKPEYIKKGIAFLLLAIAIKLALTLT